jgi:hypothetical protein
MRLSRYGVRIYDGHYPEEFESLYLDYFEMTADEFHEVLNRWTNTELFEVNGHNRSARFTIS